MLLLWFHIAILIFIGHGSDPLSASLMPPFSDRDTGRLIFLTHKHIPSGQMVLQGGILSGTNYYKAYDDLSDFQLVAGKTLFICQACYSGNTINRMAQSKRFM